MKKIMLVLTAMFVSVSFTSCSNTVPADQEVYIVKSFTKTENKYIITVRGNDTVLKVNSMYSEPGATMAESKNIILEINKDAQILKLEPGEIILFNRKTDRIEKVMSSATTSADRLLVFAIGLIIGIILRFKC